MPCTGGERKQKKRMLRPLLRLLTVSLVLSGCVTEEAHPGRRELLKRARERGLIEAGEAVPGLCIDLRYRTASNLTGRPVYPPHMPALLRKSTAARLRQAQALLQAQGYGLCLWDGWRPPEAHERLVRHDVETGLFLDPATGWSRHCAGIALDATLVDLTGRPQRMPTAFDDNLPGAASDQRPADPEVRRNLEILHGAMRAAGFRPLPGEWWHFDDLEFLYTRLPVIRASHLGLQLPP